MSEAMRFPAGSRLRVEAAVAGLTAAAVVLVAGHRVVRWHLPAGPALGWALLAGVVLCLELGFLWTLLGAVRDAPDAPTRRSLGVANLVTLSRGGLFAAVAGFLAISPRGPLLWGPALCYGAGVLLDWADGALARSVGRTTRLGEKLDLAFDTLGFVVAPLVAVAWGRLPVWYLSLSAARYVFKAGVAWRRRRGRPVRTLPASRLRRPLAALQMMFITVALTPVVPADRLRIAAAVVLTPSLLLFGRDYLAVSNRLSNGLSAHDSLEPDA